VSYLFYRLVSDGPTLVNIGLISFVAASQFAPVLLGGLFWRRANLKGAAAGLTCGALVWFFTLVVPELVRAGWVDEGVLSRGLFGWSWLRPQALFGLEALPWLAHALFWSLLFNIGALAVLSLLTEAGAHERDQAEKFRGTFAETAAAEKQKRFSRAPTVMEFAGLMAKFIGRQKAHEAVAGYLENKEIDERGSLAETELTQMRRFAERTMAGSVGAAPARIIVDNYLSSRGSTMEDVLDIFGSVTISRKAGREQLGVLHEATRIVASGADLQAIFSGILELLRQQ
ncbi:MAG: stage II sporulation protein E, partial [Desulfuromonadales bacterium]|nr:stage II sporulation protein E [Desulfuromonadales bacterium]NIS41303.1 stage II sporulation protein E [Desulfuromonadales bacterium]